MTKDWILQKKETRRKFSNSTWIPLKALCESEKGGVEDIGYISEYFGCNSLAFPPEYKDLAEDLKWSNIGIGLEAHPYAFSGGHYKTIDQYEWNEKESVGVHLIFDHPQPVIGGRRWIINPDSVVALRLIREKIAGFDQRKILLKCFVSLLMIKVIMCKLRLKRSS